MKDFYIGFALTLAIILFLELFRKVEKKLTGAMILACIAFIYLGFSSKDVRSLPLTIGGAAFFFWLAYLGYKRSVVFTVIGLILHDIFCLTIDIFLAIYFALRIKTIKPQLNY